MFINLFIGHLVGDWLFQPDKWAIKKTTNIFYLYIHCLVYSLSLMILSLFETNLTNAWIIFMVAFLTHRYIDTRKPVIWWMKVIKQDPNPESKQWLIFILDQCFHIIIIWAIARWLM